MMKLFLSLTLLFFQISIAAAAPSPRVVVSIKPVHSLVAGVMKGVGEPQLLVKGGGSPHGYVMRPSEAQALSDAQLIVWVGPGLEGFLEKSLSTLAQGARQLELAEQLKGNLLPARSGGTWETGHHDHEATHDHDDHAQSYDLHIWLSPTLAREIVRLTSEQLIAVDPANADLYRQNAQSLSERLNRLDQRLKKKLEAVTDIPYVVFHAAYQYFEQAYGLNAVGAISIDPERRPGVRRVLEIREKIETLKARCVFSEPQFQSSLVETITEGTNLRTGILDPLGADLTASPEMYFNLMERLADNLYNGLKP